MTICYTIFGIPRTIDEAADKSKTKGKPVILGMFESYITFETYHGRFSQGVLWQIWEHQPFVEIDGTKYKIGKPAVFEHGRNIYTVEFMAKGIMASRKEAESKLDKMKQKLQDLGAVVDENYKICEK